MTDPTTTSPNYVADDVVISGISGRFPESDSIDELRQKLFDGVDLVTNDERRWPSGLYGLSTRTGKIKNLSQFDATFFGVHAKQAKKMDPQLRILLESTYEALVDAGINPAEVRGSRTAVFIGVSLSESGEYWKRDPDAIDGYELLGNCTAMFPNRISYTFDFNGPSYAIDAACSSSLIALQRGFDAIKSGECDAAVVGGSNIMLQPHTALQFIRLNLSNPEGKCKAFDKTGNGYVRSEAVGILYLQRASTAKRVYATILGAKVNTDGYKDQGITFPSGAMQSKLLRKLYSEIGINPTGVSYLEAHGTGTKVGDLQEVNSIADVFCNNRKKPLLIGSVKSNLGHAELASGICSLTKLVIAMESGVIPGNLHFETPNPYIQALHDGRLKVVAKNEPWNGGIVGVNGSGFGGANAHVVLRSNSKLKTSSPLRTISRVVTVSGRTEIAVNRLLDECQKYKDDDEFLALIDSLHTQNIVGHGHRGYDVLGVEHSREISSTKAEKRPIWYIFTGMGSQWSGMAKDLLQLDIFKNSIEKSSEVLSKHDLNLQNILVESDFENVLNSFVTITAVQIALTDVLTSLNIIPDGIVGHSMGEVSCAYADGTFTAEQAILASYFRGRAILESNLEAGSMAAVSLTWEECKQRCPPGIFPACHNSKDNVTISGPPQTITNFLAQLESEGLFAKLVNDCKLAFHSNYIADAAPKLKKSLDSIIPNPKPRSAKWISTSIPEADWNTPLARTSSPAYHVNNLLSPVLFQEAIQHIPKNAIAIEIAPHGIFQAILKRAFGPNVTNISLSNRNHSDNVKFLISNIGKLYNAGAQPNIKKLYRPVTFPVSRGTPMINSMIEWDHSMEWDVADFSGKEFKSGENIVNVNLNKEEYAFLSGHVIDGRILFPVTYYLILAWKTLAKWKNEYFEKMPVVFENVRFHRITFMPKDGSVKFLVNILYGSGKFEISESGSVVVSGKIIIPEDITKEMVHMPKSEMKMDSKLIPLVASDLYKELRLRGYEYEGVFQGITESDNRGINGTLKWKNNWTSFIDTMLQFQLLSRGTRELYLPTRMQRAIIDPKSHLKALHQQDSKTLQIHTHGEIGIVKCGGIELRGIKTSLVPRRQQSQTPPKFEKYEFIPLHNTIALKDENKSKKTALTILSHIALENSCALKLKIVEEATDRSIETVLAKHIKDILEAEPMISVDYTVITSGKENLDDLKSSGIKIIVLPERGFRQNAHVVVMVNSLSQFKIDVIQNTIALLKPGGFLLLEEPEVDYRLIAKVKMEIISIQVAGTRAYILLRKPVDVQNNSIVIKITDKHFSWLEPLKKAMAQSEIDGTKIYLVCQGEPLTGLIGMMNCIKQESGGANFRSFFINDSNVEEFSLNSLYYKKQIVKNLVHNVLKNNVWGSFRHLPLDQSVGSCNLKVVEHAYINTLTRGDLTSLKWIEGPSLQCKPNKSELCTVYYAAINFRDIMLTADENLSPDALSDNLDGQECKLGVEFSGRDSKGRRVMGLVSAGGLATTRAADPDLLWEIPEKWSLEEAATIPTVYATSYYALIVRGQLGRGESILIHAGARGVGQAAITIALHMGCTVFTTVGSRAKRDFLKKTFPQLDDNYIGNSKDTTFEQLVLQETNGRGIDVIFNCLAGEQLQASVRCLAVNGRFLEIGKVDLSNNASLGMNVFLKNTSFSGIFLNSALETSSADKKHIIGLMNKGIKRGVVRPLPRVVFSENQVEQAFRFRASSKHVGQVLLKIRDEEDRSTLKPKLKTFNAIPRAYMSASKCYVIVGGLGGFGLELTNWLIFRGATKVVLISRSGLKTGYQSFCVRRWRENGVKVLISTTDVTTQEEANKVLEEVSKLGPIGGIFNLAVVLHDALIEHQTENDFKTVTKAKVEITKSLDAASRIFATDLDYFVVFSSVSCGRGIAGQTNYGLANSAMERICEARRASGLPGLAIQWGAIGDVGLFVETTGGNDKEIGGSLPQRIASCLATMDVLLQQRNVVVSSMVLADKKKSDGSATEINILDAVANIMGIKDTNTVAPNVTLSDIGIDSLMTAEIKQTLERNYDVMLNAQKIRELTFKRLIEFAHGNMVPTEENKTSNRDEEAS